MENNQSFWQFSDQLRIQSSNLANLSLNDSIWSNNYISKRQDERINFDIKVGGEINSFKAKAPASDYNDGWKEMTNMNGSFLNMPQNILGVGLDGGSSLNGGFNKGIYSKPAFSNLHNNNLNINPKGHKFKGEDELVHPPKPSKKNSNPNKKHGDNNNNDNKDAKAAADKRFKTLPPSESLPRNETIGGYIFVCNNDTMAENLKRQLFGLPPRYRDSVRAITPGLPLFLYNYSTHQLHGIFEAASFGGTNIDPTAWEDKKCAGESRFPAQVRVITRKTCEPLEEDSFRPILHHYDGPKFRLELNVPEALSLLDIFAEQDTFNDTFKALPA
ncbi:B2 protein [Abrus precatorius]|uniref:B2 protein n=1 Tax=Abrus precatorius TaxID=3816 RepID=A0A8B8KBJ6_ABRPR|nr:B2 protein [Abrus precatorius]